MTTCWSTLFLVKYSGLSIFLESEECFVTFCRHLLGEALLVVKGGTASFYPKLQTLFSHYGWGVESFWSTGKSSRLSLSQTKVVLREDGGENCFYFSKCYKSNNDTKENFENKGRTHLYVRFGLLIPFLSLSLYTNVSTVWQAWRLIFGFGSWDQLFFFLSWTPASQNWICDSLL